MMEREPWLPGHRTVARTATRDCAIELRQRGTDYAITSCDQVLMTSADTRSERALGRLAASRLRGVPRPRVLLGGLGMGFTLRALLDRLPRTARVVVAELLGPVVRWNRVRLRHLSRDALADPRVQVYVGDVARLVPARPVWDAIVLDVDNGPEWAVKRENQALYSPGGLRRLVSSLRPGGSLTLWSGWRHRPFERRLASMRLGARSLRTGGALGGTGRPVIYVVPARALARAWPCCREARAEGRRLTWG